MKNLNVLLLLAFICLPGCVYHAAYEPPPNSYYFNPAKDLNDIGKVALLELTSHSVVPGLSVNVTESLLQEIQKEQIFSLIKVPHDDSVWRRLQLKNDDSYSYEELAQIRNVLRCDAILSGTITVFEPYPHMTIGLRLRLIDLSDGSLIWAMEQVWDATDKTTRDRIEAYYNPQRILVKDENLSGQLGSVSSLKFLKFVAHEITMTLQTDR